MKKTSVFHTQVDLLHGPVFKSMVAFAIPLFISNLFQQLYNMMDMVIVGHVLGDTSLAAIGACSSIYELLIGFAFGISGGLTIVTARSFGCGDRELLKKSVAASIVIGIFITIIMTIVTRVMLYPLLEIMNTPSEIIDEAYSYISTITLFICVLFAYNLCSGLLRAIGNSFMPLIFLIISSCINIVLDLLFIKTFGMGVRGAAIATVIAQGISAVLCILYIISKTKLLVPQKSHFALDKKIYRELLTQGFAMGFSNCFIYSGSVILQTGINGLGYLTIAGHIAGRKLYMFCNMPFSAISHSINTFVSQNRGADQGYRIRQSVKYAYYFHFIMAAVVTVFMIFAAPVMVRLVSGSTEAEVIRTGSLYLWVGAPFYSMLGVVNTTRNALHGLGQKLWPLLSSVIEFFCKILFVIVFIPIFHYPAIALCEPLIWCLMNAELVYSFYHNPYIKKHKYS